MLQTVKSLIWLDVADYYWFQPVHDHNFKAPKYSLKLLKFSSLFDKRSDHISCQVISDYIPDNR
jgi:hypothetical protein